MAAPAPGVLERRAQAASRASKVAHRRFRVTASLQAKSGAQAGSRLAYVKRESGRMCGMDEWQEGCEAGGETRTRTAQRDSRGARGAARRLSG